MTLEEAILRAEEVAKQQEGMAWEAELQEVAEWLKELKEFRERMEDDLK